jgi:hypothetical protein
VTDKPDKLVLTGIRKGVDGEYPCDIVGMLTVGHPEMLTYREGHRLKNMTGIRAGEVDEALAKGDTDLVIGLAAIVLARDGKTVSDDLLWDAPMEAGIQLVLGEREAEEEPDESPLPETSPTGSSDASSPTSGSNGETDTASPTSSPDSGSGTSGSDTSASDPIRLVV